MLLYEIDGNRYKKSNYDAKGQLESFQILNVGSIEPKGNIYKLPVEIINYNKDGIPQDTTKTLYTCDPADREIFVNIFPYSNYAQGGEIKVRPLDTNSFYPVDPTVGWKMEPLHFEMKINEGVVGFLGGKSKVKMYSRQVVKNDTLSGTRYEIDSNVNVGIYVLGIKVKNFDYRVIEILEKQRGLIFQKFLSEDQSYFSIRLVNG